MAIKGQGELVIDLPFDIQTQRCVFSLGFTATEVGGVIAADLSNLGVGAVFVNRGTLYVAAIVKPHPKAVFVFQAVDARVGVIQGQRQVFARLELHYALGVETFALELIDAKAGVLWIPGGETGVAAVIGYGGASRF